MLTPTDAAVAARRIHDTLPVVDGHNDLPWAIRTRAGSSSATADPRRHLEGYHTDFPRMLAGGVGALDAAGGLDLGRLQVEAEEGLVPVVDTDLRVLLRGRLARDLQPSMYLTGHRRDPRPPLTGVGDQV